MLLVVSTFNSIKKISLTITKPSSTVSKLTHNGGGDGRSGWQIFCSSFCAAIGLKLNTAPPREHAHSQMRCGLDPVAVVPFFRLLYPLNFTQIIG